MFFVLQEKIIVTFRKEIVTLLYTKARNLANNK